MVRHIVLGLALGLCACGGKKEKARDAEPAPPSDSEVADDAVAIDAAPAEPARTEHDVYDLVDNRHAAHRMVA
ncbi:MAG: hypothetical protein AB7O24_31565, partial [Kofleriaceae bacterium]